MSRLRVDLLCRHDLLARLADDGLYLVEVNGLVRRDGDLLRRQVGLVILDACMRGGVSKRVRR